MKATPEVAERNREGIAQKAALDRVIKQTKAQRDKFVALAEQMNLDKRLDDDSLANVRNLWAADVAKLEKQKAELDPRRPL